MALVEGALLATVQHWPTATEVVVIPLCEPLVHTLGAHLSVVMGRVTRAERALVSVWLAAVLWMSILLRGDRPAGGDVELGFLGTILGHIRWSTTMS